MMRVKRHLSDGPRSVLLFLFAALLVTVGCTEANRAVVVNGNSSSLATVEFSWPREITDNVGGIVLGPSANRVALWGQEAYVVNSGTFGAALNASLQVVDLLSSAVVRTIPLPDGNSPWDIVILSAEKAYVTNLYGDSVSVLDPRGVDWPSAFIKTIALPEGSSPAGIVVDGGRAYTANTGLDSVTYMYGPATVSVIDTATDTIVDADGDSGNGEKTPIPVTGVNPQDLAVDAEGNVWVVCTGDWSSSFGVVDVVDTLTLSETDSLAIGSTPGSIALGNRVALVGDGASASLFEIDIESRTVLRDENNPFVLTTTTWSFVPDIVFDRSGEVAFALAFTDDTVFEIGDFNDTLTIRPRLHLATGSGPAGIALSYD